VAKFRFFLSAVDFSGDEIQRSNVFMRMNTKHALIRLTALTILTLFAFALPARAANQFPPGKMTFQGFLTDAATPPMPLGSATPENKTVIFKIYRGATGTAATDVLWAESQVVTVDKGHFSVLLGEGSAVTGLTDKHADDLSSVFIGPDASDRWIGITVDGNEITPRIQFFAAPYAQLAKAANSLVNPSGQTILNLANGKLEGTSDLTVTGNVGSSGSLAGLSFNNREGGSIWQWYSSGGTARLWNGGDVMAVTSDGKLGIGTTTPASTLHVNGAASVSGMLGIGTTSPDRPVSIQANGNEWISLKNSSGATKWHLNDSNGGLNFAETLVSDGRLFLAPGGNVGIGTTSPSTMLQVGQGINQGLGGLLINTGWQDPVNPSVARPFEVQVRSNSYMVVNTQGNVGIGTATPAAKLHINGGVRIDSSSILEFGGGVAGKQGDAGKIGYQAFSQALDIIGAGASTRTIRLWDQVGIGTASPTAPLEVSGSIKSSQARGYAYLTGGANVSLATDFGFYSILASDRIGASEYNAFSDARIKTVVSLSDNRRDLDTIQKLRVTDYRMVDKVAEGETLKKGFIAQEVEAVIPEAVTSSRRFVPDIYLLPSAIQFDEQRKTLAVTLPKPHGLKTGDRARIIADESQLDLKVMGVPSATEFVVENVEKSPKQIFVYGKEVSDFRTLNYDRIFSTGIGAIQELARQVQALKKSEARIAELEQKAARVDSLQRELTELKKLVVGLAQSQTPGRVASSRASTTVSE
jgi:hypothetical protein